MEYRFFLYIYIDDSVGEILVIVIVIGAFSTLIVHLVWQKYEFGAIG